MVGILNKSDDCECLASLSARSRWDIERLLTWTRVDIVDDHLFLGAEKLEVQLVGEEQRPRIRTGTAEEDEVVIASQV